MSRRLNLAINNNLLENFGDLQQFRDQAVTMFHSLRKHAGLLISCLLPLTCMECVCAELVALEWDWRRRKSALVPFPILTCIPWFGSTIEEGG